MIAASIKRTNRVMIAEQTTRGITLGPQIASEIQARFLDHLDHEILTVSGGRASPTVSAPLNRAAIAGKAEVAAALRQLVPQ
jgi:2-oxoisovalerate dehydrogenase E1 component